jgi:hypothetical protein
MSNRGVGPGSVLVVEANGELRGRMTSWLESSGFAVMACPGPSAPEYGCVGLKRGECPLAKGADLVVLDDWTDADRASAGPAGRWLLRFYARLGLPVLRVSPGKCHQVYGDEYLADVEWPPDRRELVETARSLYRLSPTDRKETE